MPRKSKNSRRSSKRGSGHGSKRGSGHGSGHGSGRKRDGSHHKSHSSSDSDRGRKKRKHHKHKRSRSKRSRSRSHSRRSRNCGERACPSASLSFDAKHEAGAEQIQPCTKYYLSADSRSIDPKFILSSLAVQANAETQIENIVPIHARHMIITWEIQLLGARPPEDATRYTITIDRTTGPVCGATPLVKFQVPLENHAIDDCHFVQQSKLRGSTQPFRVNLCPGEEIAAGFTERVGIVCPAIACGVPDPSFVQQTDPAPLARVLVKVFLY